MVTQQEGRKTKRRTHLPEAVDSAAPPSFEVRRGSPTLSAGAMRFPSLATSEHPLSPVRPTCVLEDTRNARPAEALVSPAAPRRATSFPKTGVLLTVGKMGNSEISSREGPTLGSPLHAARRKSCLRWALQRFPWPSPAFGNTKESECIFSKPEPPFDTREDARLIF